MSDVATESDKAKSNQAPPVIVGVVALVALVGTCAVLANLSEKAELAVQLAAPCKSDGDAKPRTWATPEVRVLAQTMENAFYQNRESAALTYGSAVRVSGKVEDIEFETKKVILHLHPEILAAQRKSTVQAREGEIWTALKTAAAASASRHFIVSARLADCNGFLAMKVGAQATLDCERVEVVVDQPRAREIALIDCHIATGCGDPENAMKSGHADRFATYSCRKPSDKIQCLKKADYATPASPLGCPEPLMCCEPD